MPHKDRMGSKELRVCFAGFSFDPGKGRLWSGSQEIRLTPKAAAVLAELVRHAGEPVSKEELLASVWSGTIVSDDALTTCIQELRKALGDDARQPKFIETRHRRGYRLIAPLLDHVADIPAEASTGPGDITSIAVLPFTDMSPGRDQDYLCEGLAEELINALTQVEGLRVASRTASFQFRTPGADIQAIGQLLNVGTLLEGSVRRADGRLRVTVQLVEVASGYHRWSKRFDHTLEDVFAVQDEIASTVAASLRGDALSYRERQLLHRPHTRAAAYEFYLRGRQYLPRMTQSDLHESAVLFRRAIDLDSSYSPALAGLALVQATLYEWFGAKEEDLTAAQEASRRALELAPGLAEAHVARGFVLSLSRRYDEAAKEFEEAIARNPNLFDGYYYFARSCFACGDVRRSVELFRRAAQTRQEDYQSPVLLAQSLRMIGEHAEARKATREGVRRSERMLELNARDGRALALGAIALFDSGEPERALEWSRRSLELYPDDMSTLINAACLRAKAARKAEALDLLERVFARGWGKRDWVIHDPDYDILRGEPRFKRLLEKLK